MVTRIVGTMMGAITAGIGSAVCCSGPLVAAAFGVSGAGLLVLRPYRPLFVFVAVALLWTGFYLLDQQDEAALQPDRACLSAPVRRKVRVALWVATAMVLVFGTSSRWLPLVI